MWIFLVLYSYSYHTVVTIRYEPDFLSFSVSCQREGISTWAGIQKRLREEKGGKNIWVAFTNQDRETPLGSSFLPSYPGEKTYLFTPDIFFFQTNITQNTLFCLKYFVASFLCVVICIKSFRE